MQQNTGHCKVEVIIVLNINFSLKVTQLQILTK